MRPVAVVGASLWLGAACSAFEGDPEPPAVPPSGAAVTPGDADARDDGAPGEDRTDAAVSAPRVRCNLPSEPKACSGETPVCCRVFTETPSTCGPPDATCTNAFRCDDATDCAAFGAGSRCCGRLRDDRTALLGSVCLPSCGSDDLELCDTASPATQACSGEQQCRPSGRLPDASSALSPTVYDFCRP